MKAGSETRDCTVTKVTQWGWKFDKFFECWNDIYTGGELLHKILNDIVLDQIAWKFRLFVDIEAREALKLKKTEFSSEFRLRITEMRHDDEV